MVAIEPVTGEVVWADAFDTHASEAESRRLAEAIGALAAWTIVAAAVRDERSRSLGDEAVAALRSLGARGDVRGLYRASHLVVGAKGAPPGSALERLAFTPVGVTLGLPAERGGVEIRDFALR